VELHFEFIVECRYYCNIYKHSFSQSHMLLIPPMIPCWRCSW